MPSAYGRDRVSPAGGAFIILATRDKGWRARTRATRTSAEFPGTAVEWDGAMYEVVARSDEGGRVRYRMEPWKSHHVIRQMDYYDEASEAARLVAWNEHARRMRTGLTLQRLGLFVGMLPAEAQKHISTRFGVSLTRLAMWSTIPSMIFGLWCARYLRLHPELPYTPPPFPEWMIPFGLYFFLESIIRLRSYLGGRPMGSIVGWIVYLPWLLFGGTKVLARIEQEDLQGAAMVKPASATNAAVAPQKSYREVRKEWGDLPTVEADAERKLHDAYIMREPYISFLSVPEQVAMHERFGFDPVDQGKRTVAAIAIMAGLGAAVSIFMLVDQGVRFSRIVSIVVAIALLVEQFARMRLLSDGRPAPSVLAPLFRPFLRKVLSAPPVQPVYEGENRNVELPDVWEGE